MTWKLYSRGLTVAQLAPLSLNCRELENNLRAAEILFTVTYHGARQSGDAAAVTHFSSAYFDLVQVRPAFVREIF